jgi:hypothetical protein
MFQATNLNVLVIAISYLDMPPGHNERLGDIF